MPFTQIDPDRGLIDLDGAKCGKSSVSYADSSFGKGAIGGYGGLKSVADTLPFVTTTTAG